MKANNHTIVAFLLEDLTGRSVIVWRAFTPKRYTKCMGFSNIINLTVFPHETCPEPSQSTLNMIPQGIGFKRGKEERALHRIVEAVIVKPLML
jgi:hypothetical protein